MAFAVPGFRPGVVSLLVGGMLYEGWEEVEVSRSVKEMAGQFRLKVSERFSGGRDGPAMLMGWRIRPGDPCVVLYSGLPVITGYVDTYCPKYDANKHEVQIQGRSKTADMVDSTADPDVPNGEMREVTLPQIANRLAGKHGIGVRVQADASEKFDVARTRPGETKHEMLERYARPGAVCLTDDAMGNLRLLHVMGGGGTPLIEGVNILEASATLRADNRFSDYETRGQDHGSEDKRFGREASEIMAKAKDGFVKRYRPYAFKNDTTKTSRSGARKRCDWEASSRAGESTKADVKVVDWIGGGGLWTPGDIVMLISPMLAINRPMAIEAVKFQQSDSNGTTTDLSLVPPEALKPGGGGGGGGGGGSDAAWSNVKPASGAV